MGSTLLCISCSMGECEGHRDTPAPKGVLGGNRCPCNHAPDAARRRRDEVLLTVQRRFDGKEDTDGR